MGDDRFTLHLKLWGAYRRLPRLVQAWLVVVLIGAAIWIVGQLSGPSQEQRVRDAIAGAVAEATGPSPAVACSALSAAGLSDVVAEFGPSLGVTSGGDALAACHRLAVEARAALSLRLTSVLAGGTVGSVRFQSGGSAVATFVVAGNQIAAELTLSESAGRWLIDKIVPGAVDTAVG